MHHKATELDFFWKNFLILSVLWLSLSFLRAPGSLPMLPAGFVACFLGLEALNESSCQSVLGELSDGISSCCLKMGGW